MFVDFTTTNPSASHLQDNLSFPSILSFNGKRDHHLSYFGHPWSNDVLVFLYCGLCKSYGSFSILCFPNMSNWAKSRNSEVKCTELLFNWFPYYLLLRIETGPPPKIIINQYVVLNRPLVKGLKILQQLGTTSEFQVQEVISNKVVRLYPAG